MTSITPGTVWENVGLATTTGIDEAIALNAQLGQSIGIATIRVDTLTIAEAGNKVLTERIDHLVDAAVTPEGIHRFSHPASSSTV